MFMGLGMVLMFLFWGGLVVLAIGLIGALFPRAGRAASPDNQDLDARGILNRRYARGEITRAQCEMMKQTISDEIR